ncbi:CDP-alcohol phosphatidyltransferase family protein [Phreatobacter oligotrophus]|uniref:CDP-alcohol phosphatidyltransferase family protein n=1 Tax=Phreatobacter oligotrophus TaxID=1122261 RepID=UPI00235763F5|nr:CDP-alcohol phosphatidyltransferase family protein [Phreatobacter oligotrophus]MBX9992127.1 CDP-alcohol phosphatidyltransferase family protein [Phreatobacter oligotrophus]
MLDPFARRIIDPPLNRAGLWLAGRGVTANMITGVGLVVGCAAALSIAAGQFLLGLLLIAVSRIADGLDGAVARARGPTDLGGYFDILADFAFYAAVPVAFGIADPANALPALVLVASFLLSGTSFLAFATIAAKRGMTTTARGEKSFFHAAGLAEGSETILAFALMCLFPQSFGLIAWLFAAMCLVTAAGRCLDAARLFHDPA